MKTKSPAPISLLEGERTHPLIEAYFEFNQLKKLYDIEHPSYLEIPVVK